VISRSAAIARVESLRPVVSGTIHSLALLAIAVLLILGLLPAALGAAGPEIPIVVVVN